MGSFFTPTHGPWIELVIVLAVGTALIVGLAFLAGRTVRSAIWRRTIWQSAALGVWALVAFELTGAGSVVVHLVATWIEPARAEVPTLIVDHRVDPPEDSVGNQNEQTQPLDGHSPPADTQPAITWEPLSWPDPPKEENTKLISDEIRPAQRQQEEVDFRPITTPTAATTTVSSIGPATEQAPVEVAPVEVAPVEVAPRWWPGLLWISGAMIVLTRLLRTKLRLRAFCQGQVEPADAALCRRVGALAGRLGLGRPVRVVQARRLTTPVAFGRRRPTIALPARFAEDFDRHQQDAMLAHELAHLTAGDPSWQLSANLLCAILWWHPAVWWARHRLHATGEAAADEASRVIPGGPEALADCLVRLGRQLVPAQRLGWLSVRGGGFRSDLGRRVERLLRLPSHPCPTPRRARVRRTRHVLLVLLLILAISCTAWAHPQAVSIEGGTTMNVLKNSWRRSLPAVAVVALLGATWGYATADDPAADDQIALADDEQREGERKEGERRDGEREREEGERREGDRDTERGEGERREGDRERREGDRDREEGERREGDRDREHGEREHAERGEGDREHGDREHAEREAGERREHAEAERRERAEMERHAEELTRHRAELLEKANHLRRQREGLRDGQDDAAREINGALEQIEKEVHGINERLGQIHRRLQGEQPDREQPDHQRPDRERLEHRLHELRQAIGQAAEAGQREKAEQLERQAREIIQFLERGEREGREERPQVNEELERRIHHMRAAAENLRAAGMHDAAESIMRQAERMIHGGADQPRRDQPRRDQPRPDGPPQLEHVLRQMQEQMGQMQRQMNEMREQIQELSKRER